jgi:two-component system, response regulator PdtaR
LSQLLIGNKRRGPDVGEHCIQLSVDFRDHPEERSAGIWTAMPSSDVAVLIVEDEPLILMNAVDIMQDAGFSTYEAASAKDAIAILEQHRDIRAVFTDIQIVGDPDGLKLAHLVRERWPPVGLLITSGRITPETAELPAGGMFLAKPYAPRELIASLRAVVADSYI